MTPKHLIYLLFSVFIVTACGLDEDADDEDSDNGDFSLKEVQNSYLPLSASTSMVYSGDVTATISRSERFGDDDDPAYAILLEEEGSDSSLTLHVTTTASTVSLLSIDGPISAAGLDGALERVDFDPAVELIGADEGEGEARITIEDIPVSLNLDYNYEGQSVTGPYTGSYGDLPRRRITSAIDFEIPNAFTDEYELPDTVSVNLEFSLSKGIGIIELLVTAAAEGVSASQIFSSELESLVGLPLTIWFDNSEAAGEPTLASGSDSTFKRRTSAGGGTRTISSGDYRVHELDELNKLGWLTVKEDTASNSYQVSLKNHDDLPDELHSEQIIFVDKKGNHLSGSIVLHAPTD